MTKHTFLPCVSDPWWGWLRCTKCRLRIKIDELKEYEKKECDGEYSPWSSSPNGK